MSGVQVRTQDHLSQSKKARTINRRPKIVK